MSSSRTSKIVAAKHQWNGVLSWKSDCLNCPLLFFTVDYENLKREGGLEANAEVHRSEKEEDTKRLISRAREFLRAGDNDEALMVILEAAKSVSYKVNEDELTLLISTAEIVISNHLQGVRQVTIKDISHAIGFVKANVQRTTLGEHYATEEEVNAEKEDFCNLLLKLVDVVQCIRTQMSGDGIMHSESCSQTDGTISLDTDTDQSKRFNLYLTFFSLLIQSAFLEAGLVAGRVYMNRLVGNAEEAYYLTHDSNDKKVEFMKPLGAYIYGRLWCETDDDESHGAYFLSEFYKKNGAHFEALLDSCPKDQSHSTYFCNMRRIRQTIIKYQHHL